MVGGRHPSQGVLIPGSGGSWHNLRLMMGRDPATNERNSAPWDAFLNAAVADVQGRGRPPLFRTPAQHNTTSNGMKARHDQSRNAVRLEEGTTMNKSLLRNKRKVRGGGGAGRPVR